MGKQRRGSWKIAAGVLVLGSIGCQTMIHADRSLIPDGGGGAGGQTNPDEESDAGPDGGVIVLGSEAEVTEQSNADNANEGSGH